MLSSRYFRARLMSSHLETGHPPWEWAPMEFAIPYVFLVLSRRRLGVAGD